MTVLLDEDVTVLYPNFRCPPPCNAEWEYASLLLECAQRGHPALFLIDEDETPDEGIILQWPNG